MTYKGVRKKTLKNMEPTKTQALYQMQIEEHWLHHEAKLLP